MSAATQALEAEIGRLTRENARIRAANERRAPKPYTAASAAKFGRKAAWKVDGAAAVPIGECGCRPYVDVLTAGRWRFQGAYIRKGESAILRAGRSGTVPLFCRCQVDFGTVAAAYAPGDGPITDAEWAA
mgnify:CR=1 FL=1